MAFRRGGWNVLSGTIVQEILGGPGIVVIERYHGLRFTISGASETSFIKFQTLTMVPGAGDGLWNCHTRCARSAGRCSRNAGGPFQFHIVLHCLRLGLLVRVK